MSKIPEIISCISRKEQVECVLDAGADSIYAGLKKRSWHYSSIELSWNDFIEVSKTIHYKNKRLYIAVNRNLSNDDIDEIMNYSYLFENNIIDALIVSDYGCIKALKKKSEKIEIHLSANASCIYMGDFKYAVDLGVDRIVFSPSFSITEMEKIINSNISCEWEAVVYGGICFNEVGNCPCNIKSMNNIYSNTCRINYQFINNNHLKGIDQSFGLPNLYGENVRDFYNIGINHWKIEGRSKGIEHIIKGTRKLKELTSTLNF